MLTLNKTKAALPSCQCHYKELNQIQHTRPEASGQSLTVPANTGARNFPQWGELLGIEISADSNVLHLRELAAAEISEFIDLHRWWKLVSNRVANLQLAICTQQGYTPSAQTYKKFVTSAISPDLGRPIFNRGRNSALCSFYVRGGKVRQRLENEYLYELSFEPVNLSQFLGGIVAHSTTLAASGELGAGQSFLSSFSQLYPMARAHTIKTAIIHLRICIFYSSNLSFVLFRWRRFISPLAAATRNPAVLSPSSRNRSISSITSWGILTVVICDFAFFAPVAITESPCVRCISVYAKKMRKKALRCISLWDSFERKGEIHLEKGEARQCANTNRASYHKPLFEVTVMADHQSTQTRSKYTWRFLAINRHDKKAKPCRLSVEAATESEARSILVPHFILSLAARLPAPEVFS